MRMLVGMSLVMASSVTSAQTTAAPEQPVTFDNYNRAQTDVYFAGVVKSGGFGKFRHGEAVAWGMEVAARISVMTGTCQAEDVTVQHTLLERAGLLGQRPIIKPLDLFEALQHDKKSRAGKPRWVLLREAGRAEYGCEVDERTVWMCFKEVLGI